MKIQHQAARARRAGFSLAELMVVIVIIGLLGTLVVPNVLERLTFSYVQAAKTDIGSIESALTEYAIRNNGTFPETLDALVTQDEQGHKLLDMDRVPTDPWGNEYIYEPPGGGQPNPTVRCLGKDGLPGGEGDDQDFDNHMIKNKEI